MSNKKDRVANGVTNVSSIRSKRPVTTLVVPDVPLGILLFTRWLKLYRYMFPNLVRTLTP